MATMLEVRNLKKYFDTKKGKLHAVDDISFSIRSGETLGVVGESGCGRTVLRLIEPTSGEVLLDGNDVTKMNAKELDLCRKDMQIIFQDPFSSLNPRMTVGQIISEPFLIDGSLGKAEIQKIVLQLMETVGLSKRLYFTYPHELDGGRRQRIGIARALALEPKFIVCDEPVSALDVSIQAQILNLMINLQEQRQLSYMFITHDLSVVRFVSQHIMVMYLGQTVEYAETATLFANPLHPYTKALLSAVPIPDVHVPFKRVQLEGELKSPINPGPGCRFAARCPYATEKCNAETPVLKELEPNHMVACSMI